jgi:hypothetical protein
MYIGDDPVPEWITNSGFAVDTSVTILGCTIDSKLLHICDNFERQ